jgi:hypothetical protein
MSYDGRLQLARGGARLPEKPDVIAGARAEFDCTNALTLPGFLDPPLLAEVRAHVAAGEFQTKVHHHSGVELCMAPNAAVWLLRFLIVSPEVLGAIAAMTGLDDVRSFFGRVYRFMPGTDHRHDWHDDLGDGRLLGFSVNLGDAPFDGGALELRDRDSGRSTATIRNVGAGDAVAFRIAAGVEHRVHGVTGDTPRTAFAGWFRGGDDIARMPEAGR